MNIYGIWLKDGDLRETGILIQKDEYGDVFVDDDTWSKMSQSDKDEMWAEVLKSENWG